MLTVVGGQYSSALSKFVRGNRLRANKRRHRGSSPDREDDNLQLAKRVARELEKVLEFRGPRRAAVARAAGELGLTTRQIYNYLKRYREKRTVSSLLKTKSTRSARLSDQVQAIIEQTLREKWLVPEGPDLAPVVREIAARCEEAGLDPPAYLSVQRRIPTLFTAKHIATRRSSNPNHARRLKPRPGYISAPRPLAVTQIDHTPTDIQCVEVVDAAGVFVGRAYLTLLVDVFSRCIVGFCLTLEAPSTLSVALCLAHSICRKDGWLRSRGIKHVWPTFGRPARVLADSAMEFQGAAFERGCAEYNISIKRRNRGTVNTGGVVERLLGKINGVIGRHDGRTGKSIADRDGYPSEERACLTFSELETCVALAIIDHNEEMNEKSLKVPITEWLAHAPDETKFEDSPDAVLLNFLPEKRPRLTPQGFSVYRVEYYEPWLGAMVPDRDRLDNLIVRYDPRDISRVYVWDTVESRFRSVRRRDGDITSLTLWEHLRNRREKRSANQRTATERVAISREIETIVEGARKRRKSPLPKKTLRNLVRAAHAAKAPKPFESMEPPDQSADPHPVRTKRRLILEEW